MSFKFLWVSAAVAAGVLGAAGAAQAQSGVYWSIGIGSPGVAVGVGNAPPVYYSPAPVYVQPAPVYIRPRPVYVAPPPYVYYAPPQMVYRPAPVYPRYYYGPPGQSRKWRQHRHRDWDWD